jgi:hypothetical protein
MTSRSSGPIFQKALHRSEPLSFLVGLMFSYMPVSWVKAAGSSTVANQWRGEPQVKLPITTLRPEQLGSMCPHFHHSL